MKKVIFIYFIFFFTFLAPVKNAQEKLKKRFIFQTKKLIERVSLVPILASVPLIMHIYFIIFFEGGYH
jgi:hypothetical protein